MIRDTGSGIHLLLTFPRAWAPRGRPEPIAAQAAEEDRAIRVEISGFVRPKAVRRSARLDRSSGFSGFLPMGTRKGNGGGRSVGRWGFFCNFGGPGRRYSKYHQATPRRREQPPD